MLFKYNKLKKESGGVRGKGRGGEGKLGGLGRAWRGKYRFDHHPPVE